MKFPLHPKEDVVSGRHERTAKGAYLLYIDLKRSQVLRVGSLGDVFFPAGLYAYVGSARRGIAARVSRHKRLAAEKEGKLHWHIDYLLINPHAKLAGGLAFKDGMECRISKRIAGNSGVTAPVPGFGASDCHSECVAHLYRLPAADLLPDFIKSMGSAFAPF